MYVVIDSNIWLSELGLNTSKGSAARFFIKNKKAKLALPEVIKEEVERNLSSYLLKYTSDIKKSHRQLLTVFGELKEVVLPTEQEISNKSESLFDEMELDFLHIPFSLDSAKSSLTKINDKVAPSNKNQQFKDGVIWEDCLNLLKIESVLLVTADKAFFRDRIYSKGLAQNLKEEASRHVHKLNIYSSLTELLEEIKIDISIDKRKLIDEVYKEAEYSIKTILAHSDFSLASKRSIETSTFITENLDVLYINYTAKFHCIDLTNQCRNEGILLVEGDGSYNSEKKEFTALKHNKAYVTYHSDGEKIITSNNIFLSGHACLGHRTVNHTVRHKL